MSTLNWRPGDPRPDRNPFRPSESPVFLPGDKVRDRRDVSDAPAVFRIVSRVAHLDDEIMTLRRVDPPYLEHWGKASDLVPWLVMVAMGNPTTI